VQDPEFNPLVLEQGRGDLFNVLKTGLEVFPTPPASHSLAIASGIWYILFHIYLGMFSHQYMKYWLISPNGCILFLQNSESFGVYLFLSNALLGV
jgi:hypothetical protein